LEQVLLAEAWGFKPGVYLCLKAPGTMILSYRWMLDCLPIPISPEKLSSILNAIGLEVEGQESYEEVPGGLQGLVIGKVLEVSPHPKADRLKVTRVDTGLDAPLEIVCGAPNIAAGQTVLVAPVGSTLYPNGRSPVTMKEATIRGVRSQGMICAEDEVGLGTSHEGVMVLPEELTPGMTAAAYFQPYSDQTISIGLTPNRSDAMSHLGVARDVCAWLHHHEGLDVVPHSPFTPCPELEGLPEGWPVRIEAPDACHRYTGIRISGVTVRESPQWLQRRLQAIGQRPINNVVDATNFVLHETGQPLHAFDAAAIHGSSVRIMRLPADTPFLGLDEKERRLHAEDLMICDAQGRPLCLGGVYGGINSGVSASTREIFLESAWFHPTGIRKTSFRHGLRTDAATHFEKGVDISRTLDVLMRAARLICDLSGGHLSSQPSEAYAIPATGRQVAFTYAYLNSLSGKQYAPQAVKTILQALGFSILQEETGGMTVQVPHHKTDISHPADIAEEVMRIDGFDNIPIPSNISYTPAVESHHASETLREKISAALAGLGFHEMVNNSITSSAHHQPEELTQAVRMINSLSAELDMMRMSLIESGLRTVARNLNHRNVDLQLFEFGKTYQLSTDGTYTEHESFALFTSGLLRPQTWDQPSRATGLSHLKGTVDALFVLLGMPQPDWSEAPDDDRLDGRLIGTCHGQTAATLGRISTEMAHRFEIRQDVWYAALDWKTCMEQASWVTIRHQDLPRFPTMSRDLAIVVDKSLPYAQVCAKTKDLHLPKLKTFGLFDVFVSERLGKERKSLAIHYSFRDDDATLTDEEVDDMMQQILSTYQQAFNAQVRI